MPDRKELEEMSDEELKQRAQADSAAWPTVGEEEQTRLHDEVVEINSILDSRTGEKTSFDPSTGKWSPRTAGSSGSSSGGGSFSYQSFPEHVSRYQGQIDALTQEILGREAFSYDPESDPTYQQYKESYTRAGKRAMQDTLGQVSARTGGLASSYAGAASQQTYDGYMSALADKIPELRQLAYQMYQDEGAAKRADLQMLLALEQGDYSKYQGRLSQYNADRAYNYQLAQDAKEDERYDQEWAYQLAQDAKKDERYEQEYADSREDVEWEKALEKAKTLAATGDFSGYRALNYSEEEIASMERAYQSAQAAAYGGGSSRYSRNPTGGGDEAPESEEDITEIYHQLWDDGARTKWEAYANLLSRGFDHTEANALAGYFMDATPSLIKEDWHTRSDLVDVPGYGSLPADDVERLVEEGYLQVVGKDENGNILFKPIAKQQTHGERFAITW